jgi:tRNA pseudouridine38-40 synthase
VTRFKITVEYDGTGLAGWQRQDNGPTVQAALEVAAAKLAGQLVEVVGAGRTDAGVHATGQVAHLDIDKDLGTDAVRDGLNFWLRETGSVAVVVLGAAIVPPDFHARFSAKERRYVYRILNRRTPPALDRDRVWWVPTALDAARMQEAARLLEGRHDFSTFRAAECQAASPVKTLDRLEVTRTGDALRIEARARSFLHHQVRNMAGSLKLVGEGRWSVADLATALEARDRTKGGPTAPAAGLTLVDVLY